MHDRPPAPASPPLAAAAAHATVAGRPEIRIVPASHVMTAWERLADDADAAPWLRPGWFEAWWTAFAPSGRVVAVAEDGGEVVAIAPLAASGALVTSATNYHTPAWGIAARDEAARVALADGLMGSAARRISLQFLPAGATDLGAFEAAAATRGRRVLRRVLERCPVVDTRQGWPAFEAGLRGHFRRELRRRDRGLGALGTVTFDVHAGPEGIDELLREGFAVEAAAWKGERGTAIASRASTEGFYRSVAAWAASNGWLRLAFLRLDGHPIAFDFALEATGVHALLKTGYAPELRRLAPGMLLRRRMLQRAFETGLRQYQFLGRDDPWKRAWTEDGEEQLLLQAFAPTPAGLADWAAHRWGRPVVKRLLRR